MTKKIKTRVTPVIAMFVWLTESNDEEDPAQVEDGFRTAKSYDWLVDELLDMSVASLLASSPRHPSSPLSRQHQQATFGGVAVQEKLIDGR